MSENNTPPTSPVQSISSHSTTSNMSLGGETTALPIKRGPGRPRKYPLPTPSTPSAPVTYGTPYYAPSAAAGGPMMDEMQKFIMKKKIKKYVQKYVDKYREPAHSGYPQAGYYDNGQNGHQEAEEEEEEYEEPPQKRVQFTQQSQPPTNSKLAQILGYR